MRARVVTEEQLEVRIGDAWHAFPCSLFSSTPGTDGEWRSRRSSTLTPTDYQRDDLSHLRGKAVIHLGCHIESRAAYQRLMAAQPGVPADGGHALPGRHAAGRRHVPGVHGGDRRGADAERRAPGCLELGRPGRHRRPAAASSAAWQPAMSQNVVIDLPGTDLADEILYASAHHDTQAGSPGADDNGSGVVGVIELARLLQPRPRRRTIRLISFGAEEQLSVGSAGVRARPSRGGRPARPLHVQPGQLRLASRLAAAVRQCPPGLRGVVPPVLPRRRPALPDDHVGGAVRGSLPVRRRRASPASSTTASTAMAGASSTIAQTTTSSRVSPQVIARDVSAIATWLDAMAQRRRAAVHAVHPRGAARRGRACWEDLFGGW